MGVIRSPRRLVAPAAPTLPDTDPSRVRVTVTCAGTAPDELPYGLLLNPAGAPFSIAYTNDDGLSNSQWIYDNIKDRTWLDGAGNPQKWSWCFAVPTGDYDGSDQNLATAAQFLAMQTANPNIVFAIHANHEVAAGDAIRQAMLDNAALLTSFGLKLPRGVVRPASTFGTIQGAIEEGLCFAQSEGYGSANGVEGEGFGQSMNMQDYYNQAYRLDTFLNDANSLAIMSRQGFDPYLFDRDNILTDEQLYTNGKSYIDARVGYAAGAGVPVMFSFFSHRPFIEKDKAVMVRLFDYIDSLNCPVLSPQQFVERMEVIKFADQGAAVQSGNTFTFELGLSAVPANTTREDCTLQLPAGVYTSITVEGAESYGVNLETGLVEIYKRKGFGGVAIDGQPSIAGPSEGPIAYDAYRYVWNNLGYESSLVTKLFNGDTSQPAIHDYAQALRASGDIICEFPAGTYLESADLYDGNGAAGGDVGTVELLYSLASNPEALISYDTFHGGSSGIVPSPLPERVEIGRYVLRTNQAKTYFPWNVSFTGSAPAAEAAPLAIKGKKPADQLRVNTYTTVQYDIAHFHDGPTQADNAARILKLATYSGFRFYVQFSFFDGEVGIRGDNGLFYFTSTVNWLEILQVWKEQGKEVILCFNGNFPELLPTWTDRAKGKLASWAQDADPYDPETYRLLGRAVNEIVKCIGSVAYPLSELHQATTARNPSFEPAPTRGSGLDLTKRMQVGNEWAKNWQGPLVYRDPRALATIWAVIFDGYGGTMGPDIGGYAADPAFSLILGAFYALDAGCLRGFCREVGTIFGYDDDGRPLNLPDEVDYHAYSVTEDGEGVAIEESVGYASLAAFDQVLQEFCPDTKYSKSEYGYTANADAAISDGSTRPYSYVPASDTLTSAQRVAALLLSDAHTSVRFNQDSGTLYDFRDGAGHDTNFAAGATWDLGCDLFNTIAERHIRQFNRYAAGYALASYRDVAAGPRFIRINTYTKAGADDLDAYWLTDGKGRTAALEISLPYGGTLLRPSDNTDTEISEELPAGSSTIDISETPCSVLRHSS